MNAIPTKYAGVQFRSRLEARWAAFFDHFKWPWEYEAIDLDGYIPDFVMPNFSDNEGAAIIEVKPIVEWPCAVAGCTKCTPQIDRANYDSAVAKIQNSGWTKEAYLVGASFLSVGQLGVRPWGRRVMGDDRNGIGTVFVECLSCKEASSVEDVAHFDVHGREVRRCKCGGQWHPLDVEPHWRGAGNRVQWRAPQ